MFFLLQESKLWIFSEYIAKVFFCSLHFLIKEIEMWKKTEISFISQSIINLGNHQRVKKISKLINSISYRSLMYICSYKLSSPTLFNILYI